MAPRRDKRGCYQLAIRAARKSWSRASRICMTISPAKRYEKMYYNMVRALDSIRNLGENKFRIGLCHGFD